MKTQSNKKQSILLIVFLVAIMALAAIFFTACMSDEEAFNKYGRDKAYNKSSAGAILHVVGPVDFYLDPSLTGDYLSAAKYAIAKANAISSKVTVTGNGSADSKYKFSLKSEGSSDTTLGTAFYWFKISSGVITRAEIELYEDAFPWYSGSREIKYTAMHEIGHVLGLTHPNNDVKDHSVMVQSAYAKWPRLTDYGKFDKENIKWYYGA